MCSKIEAETGVLLNDGAKSGARCQTRYGEGGDLDGQVKTASLDEGPPSENSALKHCSQP